MKKKTTLLLFLLILSIYASNINVQITAEENNFRPTSLELTPHDPISITSNSGFEVFPGSGTEEDPYLIEGYNITTTNYRSIHIIDTTKYFTIRNCYVDATWYGINIYNVAEGTCSIINNTCINNCENGFLIHYSPGSTLINNTCNNHSENGIYLYSSDGSTLINNIFKNNNWDAIALSSSDFCVVTYNLLQSNEEHGVYLRLGSDNNLIHHNTFVDNNLGGTSQACDDCTNNLWYDSATLEGNYWSDWSGIGSYSIDGEADSFDLYPLDEPTVYLSPPVITNVIHYPSTPTELDTISINATVTDDSGIYSVTLHYRINDGLWQTISMTLVSGDLYFVTIGFFAVGDTIEYYFSAIDNSVNHNLAFNDNSGFYYSFTISEVVPEFQTLSPLLPTLTFLFLVFGLVVLQRRKK